MQVKDVKQGGFGEVAMGPDSSHEGRWLAIKAPRLDLLARLRVLPGSAAYVEAEHRLRASFLQEALTWKGLWPHPNLLTAHFVIQINGHLMLAIDYAEQGNLRDLFTSVQRRGWLTLSYALHLAQQIAAGLVTLHTPAPDMLRADPIVHCDLKPENILLSEGCAKVTDFGLANAFIETASNAAQIAGVDGMDTVAEQYMLPHLPIVSASNQTPPTQRRGWLSGVR